MTRRSFNDRLLLGMKGTMSEAELHFLRARLRGGHPGQGPPRRAASAAAGRAGLRRRRARHPGPRHRQCAGRPQPTCSTTFEATGSATAVREGVPPRRAAVPRRHLKGPRKGETDWKPLAHHPCCGSCTTPATPAPSPTAGTATPPHPDGQRPHPDQAAPQEWISFIPGAHPGYITLDQLRRQPRRPGRQRRRPRPRPRRRASPAKAPPCCRASSSAAAAGGG